MLSLAFDHDTASSPGPGLMDTCGSVGSSGSVTSTTRIAFADGAAFETTSLHESPPRKRN